MIAIFKEHIDQQKASAIAEQLKGFHVIDQGKQVFVSTNAMKDLPEPFLEYFSDSQVFETDIQLSSRSYLNQTREVDFGTIATGGSTNNALLIVGPCAVESEEQIRQTAQLIKEQGLTTLRAGSYKPRTSPYSFQGLGLEGLKILRKVCDEYGLKFFSEVRDATQVEAVIEYADVVQIGAKSMYSHGILKACGKSNKPVLLKRGFGTTLQEFVQTTEFIMSLGNMNVMLCERGIRTFETKTRFTLDLCGVSWLKEHTNLPIILDPSHAMGYAYGVPDLARACMAMNVDGLLIEVHPDPPNAKSDASQQLNHQELKDLIPSLEGIASAVGKKIV